MNWINIKDQLPTENGKYYVKGMVGSMTPRHFVRFCLYKNYPTGGRFMTGDWETVTQWVTIEEASNE